MRHELLLVRHGKSAHALGWADVDRFLTERGVADATQLGAEVIERGWLPDRMLTSHAQRAAQTAALMASAWPSPPNLVVRPSLYLGGFGELQDAVRELPEWAQRAAVVGHNPDMEEATARWTGISAQVTTANLMRLGTDLPWAEAALTGGWVLLDHLVPKQLWREGSR